MRRFLPCALSAEVFAALDSGAADAAAIPIENSLAGSVLEHFDLLLHHDVKVVRETLDSHSAQSDRRRRREDRVKLTACIRMPWRSAQCRRFLAEHPAMKAVAFYDTAGSVKQLVSTHDTKAAAIASERAAAYYGAEILARGIEDDAENYTRFFLVRRSGDAETDPAANKMSVAFTLEHKPGSLVAALSALSEMGTNLTAIESRPVKGKPWEYIFYVDCKIGSSVEGMRALEELGAHCGMVKELGRYREALGAGNAGAA